MGGRVTAHRGHRQHAGFLRPPSAVPGVCVCVRVETRITRSGVPAATAKGCRGLAGGGWNINPSLAEDFVEKLWVFLAECVVPKSDVVFISVHIVGVGRPAKHYQKKQQVLFHEERALQPPSRRDSA